MARRRDNAIGPDARTIVEELLGDQADELEPAPFGVCPGCREVMRKMHVRSCWLSLRAGVTLYGNELGPGNGGHLMPRRCPDCDVSQGGAHHVGCAVAQCETCLQDRVTCGCDG